VAEPDTIWTRYISGIESARFSPDGSRIVVTTQYNQAFIMDADTGEELNFIDSEFYLNDGFLTNDNKFYYDRTGVKFDLETEEIIKTTGYTGVDYNTDNGLFYGVIMSVTDLPKGGQEFSNPRIKIYNIEDDEVTETYPLENILITEDAILSNDNRWLAVSGRTNNDWENRIYSLQLFELVDGVPEFRIEIYRGDEYGHSMKFDESNTLFFISKKWVDNSSFGEQVYQLSDFTKLKEFDKEFKIGGFINYDNLLINSDYLDAFLRITDFNTEETLREYELKGGGFIEKDQNKLLFAGGYAINMINFNSLLNSLSVTNENRFLPYELNYNQIIVEPIFNTYLFNHIGEDLSGFIQNNRINRENLPNGIYFLTIQGAGVNKVVKFFQAR
jgi:WD40 repeat protein